MTHHLIYLMIQIIKTQDYLLYVLIVVIRYILLSNKLKTWVF